VSRRAIALITTSARSDASTRCRWSFTPTSKTPPRRHADIEALDIDASSDASIDSQRNACTVQLIGPPGPFSLQVGISLRGQTTAGVAPIGR
jgi:hypothetical protein